MAKKILKVNTRANSNSGFDKYKVEKKDVTPTPSTTATQATTPKPQRGLAIGDNFGWTVNFLLLCLMSIARNKMGQMPIRHEQESKRVCWYSYLNLGKS